MYRVHGHHHGQGFARAQVGAQHGGHRGVPGVQHHGRGQGLQKGRGQGQHLRRRVQRLHQRRSRQQRRQGGEQAHPGAGAQRRARHRVGRITPSAAQALRHDHAHPRPHHAEQDEQHGKHMVRQRERRRRGVRQPGRQRRGHQAHPDAQDQLDEHRRGQGQQAGARQLSLGGPLLWTGRPVRSGRHFSTITGVSSMTRGSRSGWPPPITKGAASRARAREPLS